MPGKTIVLKFTATSRLSRLLWEKGGRRAEPLAGGRNAVLVDPVWLTDGDTVTTTYGRGHRALRLYPDNLSLVEDKPVRKAVKDDLFEGDA